MQTTFSLLYNNHGAYKKCINFRPIDSKIDQKIITERALSKGDRKFTEDTDIDRLYILQQNPDWWYLDADVVVLKWPDFKLEPGIVYVGAVSGNIDTWCFLGNGCKEFYNDLMNFYYSKNGDVEEFWSHKIIRQDKRVKIIPDGYFLHLSLSGTTRGAIQNPNKTYAGYRYSVMYDGIDWDLKVSL